MLTHHFSSEPAPELQAVFNLLPGAYLLLSPQLQVKLVSAGYQEAVAAGWPSLSVGAYAPASLAAKLRASLAQVPLTGQSPAATCRRSCQLPGQAAAGASLPGWQLVSQPVLDAAGAMSHVLCHIRLDPAQPAPTPPNAPAALATASEAGLAAVLAQLPVALCLLRGPHHLVEVFNPLAARVWGLPAAQALGRPFLDLLPVAAAVDYAAACAEAEQSSQPVWWSEMLVAGFVSTECAAPAPAYFSLRFQAVQVERGAQGGLLLLAQEVTALLQARRQVQQLQTELATTTSGLADYMADYVAELLRTSVSDG